MNTIIIDGVEYNLTPKPCFKKGDWIINNDKRIAVPTQILKIEEYGYLHSMGYTSFDKVKTDYHLWSIQDAKDGDVLYCDNGNNKTIYLFKEQRGSSNIANAYFQILNKNNELRLMFNKAADFNSNTKPATKEQRDLLFSKMEEAGYKWDAERKELRKIEQKPAWSEEDEEMLKDIIQGLKATEQLIFTHDAQGKTQIQGRIDWLKSIKPQNHWKPSEFQLECLRRVIPHQDTEIDNELEYVLTELYKQLKTL